MLFWNKTPEPEVKAEKNVPMHKISCIDTNKIFLVTKIPNINRSGKIFYDL